MVNLLIPEIMVQTITAQPSNDSCSNVSLLCPGQNLNASTANATAQCGGADGDCGFGTWCFSVTNSVWFKFLTNEVGGNATLAIFPNPGGILDAVLLSSSSECNPAGYNVIDCEAQVDTQFALTSNSLLPNTVYWVMVDGAAGNQTGFQIAVIGPAVEWTVDTSIIPATCPQSCDGSATVTPVSGTSPYSYLWNTTPAQNTQTATGLCSGNYLVTITDSIGCTSVKTITVDELPPATAVITSTDAQCSTACNGTASATLSSGKTPYSYLWSNNETTSTITGLCAGTYSATITDSSGCDTSGLVTINVLPPDTIIFSFTNTQCDCDADTNIIGSGTASATLVSGLEKTFDWQDVPGTNNAQDRTNLCNGIYTITITDSVGCKTTDSLTIGIIMPPPEASVTQENTCGTTCKAKATAEFTSSQTPYSYLWNTTPAQNKQTATGLCAGTIHSVTVTDNKGCKDSVQITIDDAPDITNVTVETTPVICASKGSATVPQGGIEGGTSPYSYLWSNGGNFEFIINLEVGTYSVTVTDSMNCTKTAEGFVEFVECKMEPEPKFSPNEDGINDIWTIKNAEVYPNNLVLVYNRWGQRVYSAKGYNNTDVVWDGKYLGGTVPDAAYFYVIYQDRDNKKEEIIKGSVVIMK